MNALRKIYVETVKKYYRKKILKIAHSCGDGLYVGGDIEHYKKLKSEGRYH